MRKVCTPEMRKDTDYFVLDIPHAPTRIENLLILHMGEVFKKQKDGGTTNLEDGIRRVFTYTSRERI